MIAAQENKRWEAIALIAFGVFLTCGIAALTVYEATTRRDHLYQSTDQNLMLLVHAFAEYTARTVQNIEQMIRSIDGDLQELDMDRPDAGKEAFEIVRRRVADSTFLSAVNVLDPRGNLRISSEDYPPKALNFADREYFQRTMADPDSGAIVIGESVISRFTGRRVVILSRRLHDQFGQTRGVLVVGIDMERWTDYFSRLAAMKDSSAALYRSDGRLIARHPAPTQAMYDHSYAHGNLFATQLARKDSGIFRSPSPVDAVERRIAYRKLDNYPLVMVITANQAIIDAQWRESIFLPMSSGLGAALVVIGLTLALLRMLLIRSDYRARLAWQAGHDQPTSLPNRYLFEDRLTQALRIRERNNGFVAILFLDLDNFKRINDTMGHATGDEVLRAAGRRIRESLRQSDTVARFGGDEFAILLPEVTSIACAQMVAAKILTKFNEPMLLMGREVTVTVSIGIAGCPTDSSDPSELMACADAAMYSAKEAGRNKAMPFDRSIVERMHQRLRIEDCLQRALARNEFRLVFQPICAAGLPIGAEALIRWRSEELGEVMPSVFIPIAESSKLIDEIGAWVLAEACRTAQSWPTRNGRPLKISVNASPRQLASASFVDLVIQCLHQFELEPDRLSIEVTESLLIDPKSEAIGNLTRLREAGIGLSLDDFGTGFASLSYLSRMPITTLKIDRSFVSNLTENRSSKALASAITAIADALGLMTIAEGVETAAQRDELIGIGCTVHQGYFYSRPREADDFRAWLAAGQPSITTIEALRN